MSRIEDLNNGKNRRLFDLLFRHQVYLEGVKSGFATNYKKMLTDLYGEFAKFVGQARYDTLDGFSRNQINEFIRRFTFAQQYFYSRYTQELIDLLKVFMAADIDVTGQIYQDLTGQPSTLALGDNQAPNNQDVTSDQLWEHIAESVIPANGMTIEQMMQGFADATTAKIKNTLMMGYANGDSVKDKLKEIVGDPDLNYQDGLFSLFTSQSNSLNATALQYVSSMVQSSIAIASYEQYQWVSIMDSHTTLICRERNGKIYNYGEGPLPPAHYNCRSKAISLTNNQEIRDAPTTFYDWLTTQPQPLLSSMVGQQVAVDILAGKAGIRNLSINQVVIPLTITEFRRKISEILT